jgi:hypothetical protein
MAFGVRIELGIYMWMYVYDRREQNVSLLHEFASIGMGVVAIHMYTFIIHYSSTTAKKRLSLIVPNLPQYLISCPEKKRFHPSTPLTTHINLTDHENPTCTKIHTSHHLALHWRRNRLPFSIWGTCIPCIPRRLCTTRAAKLARLKCIRAHVAGSCPHSWFVFACCVTLAR